MQEVSLIDLVYRAHCSSIIFFVNDKSLSDDIINLLVHDSLLLNELLLEIYELLGEEGKIQRLRLENEIISRAQGSEGVISLIDVPSIFNRPPQASFADSIQYETKQYDFWRRLLGRIQRVCMLAVPLLEGAINWAWLFDMTSNVLKSVARLVNVVFFLPRLLMNIYRLFEHLIPGSWMSAREQSVPWFIRLKTYLDIDLRGATLLSDAVLVCVAMLTCFVCVGSWSFLALYLNIALQCTEFLLSLSVMMQEAMRFEQFSNSHHSLSVFSEKKFESPKVIYLKQLEAHNLHEQSGRLLSVVARGCLAICAFTLLPSVMAFGSWLPFLAAVLSCLLIIVRGPAIRPYIQPPCPDSNLFQLVSKLFPATDDTFNEDDIESYEFSKQT